MHTRSVALAHLSLQCLVAAPPEKRNLILSGVGKGRAKYIHVVPMDPETLACRLPVDGECQGSDSGGHESDGKPDDHDGLDKANKGLCATISHDSWLFYYP